MQTLVLPIPDVGSLFATAPASVWQLPWAARGFEVERILGSNLPRNFPVIDRFRNGIATSIKSLDLRAKTYQSVQNLGRTVERYIDQVRAFNGARYANVTVRGADITGRSLELAVPRGATAAQQSALKALQTYGRNLGVDVKIIPLP